MHTISRASPPSISFQDLVDIMLCKSPEFFIHRFLKYMYDAKHILTTHYEYRHRCPTNKSMLFSSTFSAITYRFEAYITISGIYFIFILQSNRFHCEKALNV